MAARVDGQRGSRRTCGDFGGVTQLGVPCKQTAGYNVPHARGEGRCEMHDEHASSALSDAKVQFLELYGTGKVGLEDACREACGIDVRTLLRWRREDPDFDEKVLAIREDRDAIDVARVEESYVDRLVHGEASGVEVIFYLRNRSQGRWKDVREHQHAGKDGKPLSVVDLRSLLTDEDDDEDPPAVPAPPAPEPT